MRIRWKGFELPTRVTRDPDSNETYGKFVIEPFERGFGITVGNALRRVLLSSLEGTAPVWLRLDGAQHEFAAIPGIVEDVIDIALNVKGILVQFESEGPEVLKVSKTGSGPVRAGDFTAPPGVTIVNKDLVIANIEGNASFKAELAFRRGRGFIRSEDFPWKSPDTIGTIPLDASFSPVKRARWRVEETRVSKVTDYDRLLLEIWTNGTLTPEQAMVEASTILRKHLNPFVKYYEVDTEPEAGRAAAADVERPETAPAADDMLSQPVAILDLGVRAANCLAAEGVKTVGDLVSRSENEMLHIRNFGKTSLKEIKQRLSEKGLSFAPDA